MTGIFIIIIIVGIYILATILNNQTKVPEECKDLNIEECSSCHSHHCH